MRRSSSKPAVSESNNGSKERIEWELRPGGMLVQKREDEVGAAGPTIKIKVSHGSYQHEITVPAQSTFGELKKVLAQETGLEPQEQRLLFRGKEKENDECLHMAGVKDMSKVLLLEDPASKERKLEQMKRDRGISKACEAVARVKAEVDKLAEKVSPLESAVHGGTKVAEKEFVVLIEMLMMQLLKLDSIEAEGEAKVKRRIEVLSKTMKAEVNTWESCDLARAIWTQDGGTGAPGTELHGDTRLTEGKKLQSVQQKKQRCHFGDNPMGDIRVWAGQSEGTSSNDIVHQCNQ